MNVIARMVTQEQDGIPATSRIPRAPASGPAS
jgi:hypothetical protein